MGDEKKKWWKVRPSDGGAWLFLENLGDLLSSENVEPGDSFELVSVEMTEAEVEALGEFDGW